MSHFYERRLLFLLMAIALTLPVSLRAEVVFEQEEEDQEEADQPAVKPAQLLEVPQNTSTIDLTQEQLKPFSDFNRTWVLETPMSPTAFVLDRNQLEFSTGSQDWRNRIGLWELFSGIRYGFSDTLTLGIDTSVSSLGAVIGSARWNFHNSDLWSFSIEPLFAQNFTTPTYYKEFSERIFALRSMASRVSSDSRKMHLGATAGMELSSSEYEYSYSYTNSNQELVSGDSSSKNSSVKYSVLLDLALEQRIHRRHGLVFSMNPTASISKDNYISKSSRYPEYESDGHYYCLSVALGVGYQYLRESFGFHVGLALGPAWYRYESAFYRNGYNHGYEYFSWLGAGGGSLSIDYQI